MDVSAFDNVEIAKNNMLYRSRLWNAINDWKDLVENWVKSPFDMIDVPDISSKSE